MDSQLVDKIVHEVKSQGVFDEFRKDSMADVDTKPAYQNLRQRVDTTVKKFLAEQKWSPEMNKNQLRERLRKHITDSGFLDVGVERIVDQVVNPKIATVFQPKIEDIAYKYLGVPKPLKLEPMPILHQLPAFPINGNSLKIETSHLLPTDLEQVSPDSDKATVKSEFKDDSVEMVLEDKMEEDEESPPFEPLDIAGNEVKKEEADELELQPPMPSSEYKPLEAAAPPPYEDPSETSVNKSFAEQQKSESDMETQDTSSVSLKTEEQESDKDNNHQMREGFQESQTQLSQVSSSSRVSTVTNDNNGSQSFQNKSHDNAVNISEEAQMPKFSENSSDETIGKIKNELHFDIKQDEIKFEGTKRKTDLPSADVALTPDNITKDECNDQHKSTRAIDMFQLKDNETSNGADFKFSKITLETTQRINETSSSTSLDDSGNALLCIVDKSENTQISSSECKTSVGAPPPPPPPPPPATLATAALSIQSTTTKSNDKNEVASEVTPMDAAVNCETDKQPDDEHKLKREEAASNSSPSTSRHKKHSKHRRSEKDRHRDKEREKDKDKDKSRDSSDKHRHRSHKSPSLSASRQSSSSSKNHHSSSKPSSSSTSKTSHNGSSTSTSQTQKSKHSSSSSSRTKNRDDAKSHRSSGASSKERSATSSAQSKTKTAQQNDDHYASKEKTIRRKSTDSTDEEKRPPDGVNGNAANKSAEAKRHEAGETKSKLVHANDTTKSTEESKTSAAKLADEESQSMPSEDIVSNSGEATARSKIVILNEILENPAIDFIELGSSMATDSPIHVVHAEDKLEPPTAEMDALYFFEQTTEQFKERLQLINLAIDRSRQIVNSLRFEQFESVASAPSPSASDESTSTEDIVAELRVGSKRHIIECSRKATLQIDCIEYKKTITDFDESSADKKRTKYAMTHATTSNLVSPTSSDISVNSKENEFQSVEKNAAATRGNKESAASKTSLADKRQPALNKLSLQQRYTSDDLYKPRPVLGQRSRRRGLLCDSII